jgi:hypothetical protein
VLTLLVNVSARREGTTCSGKDDAADCLVRFDVFKQLLNVQHHCPVHGVELIGPVQRDSEDAAFGFGEDGLVTHRILLRSNVTSVAVLPRSTLSTYGRAAAIGGHPCSLSGGLACKASSN